MLLLSVALAIGYRLLKSTVSFQISISTGSAIQTERLGNWLTTLIRVKMSKSKNKTYQKQLYMFSLVLNNS